MIESGAGESSSYSDKEYSDAGAEVTKIRKYSARVILKVRPPTLAEIAMMNNRQSLSHQFS
jgi:alanine dehydrogenase